MSQVICSAGPQADDSTYAGADLLAQLRTGDEAAMAQLVDQRQVVTMRDVCGMSSEEVCAALEISSANQRVLLHRARAVLRAALAGYYGG
jgi:RNA polymerase sigma-70 factor (ECF subfamily)